MNTALATLAGLGFGAGIVFLVMGIAGVSLRSEKRDRGLPKVQPIRLLIALAVGAICFVTTQWFAPTVCAVIVIAFWPQLFGAAKEAKSEIAKLEGLAVWTEALRDSIATGSGLLESLRTSSSRPPEALEAELSEFHGRLLNREPLEPSLRALANSIDDAVGDQILAALILNSRAQGRQLRAVLSGLAIATRDSVQARRDIEADRRKTRRELQIIVGAVVVTTFFMAFTSENFVRTYQSFGGQVVLTVVFLIFGTAFAVMRHLSVMPKVQRFLESDV